MLTPKSFATLTLIGSALSFISMPPALAGGGHGFFGQQQQFQFSRRPFQFAPQMQQTVGPRWAAVCQTCGGFAPNAASRHFHDGAAQHAPSGTTNSSHVFPRDATIQHSPSGTTHSGASPTHFQEEDVTTQRAPTGSQSAGSAYSSGGSYPSSAYSSAGYSTASAQYQPEGAGVARYTCLVSTPGIANCTVTGPPHAPRGTPCMCKPYFGVTK